MSLEKGISEEAMPNYVLAITLLQKIALSPVITDTKDNNIINKMYNYLQNKIKINGEPSKKIYERPAGFANSEGEDSASSLEMVRGETALTPGDVEELDWSVNDIEYIAKAFKADIPEKLIKKGIMYSNKIDMGLFTEEHKKLLQWICKPAIDPRGIEYISAESIKRLLAVSYAYLWTNNHKFMAGLLMSAPMSLDTSGGDLIMNAPVQKTRLSKEQKESIQTLFPHNEPVNKNNINVVESAINDLGNSIYKTTWITLLDVNDRKEAFNDENEIVELPSSVKIHLANMVIGLEKLIEGVENERESTDGEYVDR